MPQLAEQATDPGRMRPDFQCDPTARHRPENFLQCFRIRTDSLLQLYLAGLIHDAVPTVAIAQIQSNGQFPLRNIPALRCCSGASLLHCRSPFYLCFEHVDNLGAYSIPSETGLLIPSGFVNHRRPQEHCLAYRYSLCRRYLTLKARSAIRRCWRLGSTRRNTLASGEGVLSTPL